MPYVLNLHVLLHGLSCRNVFRPDGSCKGDLRLRLRAVNISRSGYPLLCLVDIHTFGYLGLDGLVTSLDIGLAFECVAHFDSNYYKEYAIINDFTWIYPLYKELGCFYALIHIIFSCGLVCSAGTRFLRKGPQEEQVALRCVCEDWCYLRDSCEVP